MGEGTIEESQAKVYAREEMVSNSSDIKRGVQQGDILSTIFYNMMLTEAEMAAGLGNNIIKNEHRLLLMPMKPKSNWQGSEGLWWRQ